MCLFWMFAHVHLMQTDAYQPACWHSLLLRTCTLYYSNAVKGTPLIIVEPTSICKFIYGFYEDRRLIGWVKRHKIGLVLRYWIRFVQIQQNIATTYQLSQCVCLLKGGVKPCRTINTHKTMYPFYFHDHRAFVWIGLFSHSIIVFAICQK